MKNPDTVLREYVSRVSEEELRFLNSRFAQRLQGDVAEIMDVFSRSNELDRLLKDQSNSEDFNDLIDALEDQVKKESEKRSDRKRQAR